MQLKKTAKIQGISASGPTALVAGAKSKALAKKAPPTMYLFDDALAKGNLAGRVLDKTSDF